jgi:hypothetical protein
MTNPEATEAPALQQGAMQFFFIPYAFPGAS